MSGTAKAINQAINQPLLIMGVEKRLAVFNGIIGFALVAATRFQMPASLLGGVIYFVLHILLVWVSKYDPMMATIFKRSTRYSWRCYFPAKSHPLTIPYWSVLSIRRARSIC